MEQSYTVLTPFFKQGQLVEAGQTLSLHPHQAKWLGAYVSPLPPEASFAPETKTEPEAPPDSA